MLSLSLSRILLLRRRSNRPSFPCARPTSFRSFTALYAFVSYPYEEEELCSSPLGWKSSLFVTKENWLQLPNLATVSIHTFKTRLTLISRIHHQKNHKSHSPGRPTSASVLIWKIKFFSGNIDKWKSFEWEAHGNELLFRPHCSIYIYICDE